MSSIEYWPTSNNFFLQGSRVPEQHFIIAGAGISGLTSAYMLLSAGHKVHQKLDSELDIFAAYAIFILKDCLMR
jgi:hypothetical protein